MTETTTPNVRPILSRPVPAVRHVPPSRPTPVRITSSRPAPSAVSRPVPSVTSRSVPSYPVPCRPVLPRPGCPSRPSVPSHPTRHVPSRPVPYVLSCPVLSVSPRHAPSVQSRPPFIPSVVPRPVPARSVHTPRMHRSRRSKNDHIAISPSKRLCGS